jgi:hypothetical protein
MQTTTQMGRSCMDCRFYVIWVSVVWIVVFMLHGSQLYGSQLSCYMGRNYPVIWDAVAVVLLFRSQMSCYMVRSCLVIWGRSYLVIWVAVAVVLLFGSQLSCHMGCGYMYRSVMLYESQLSCYMGRGCRGCGYPITIVFPWCGPHEIYIPLIFGIKL